MLINAEITHEILGAAFEIHRDLGFGFQEVVYSNSLAVELGLRGRRVVREAPTQIHWKGHSVGTYRLDIVVDEAVVVEVKACAGLAEDHERQLMNYLRSCNCEVGLLLNFGPKMTFRRLVYSNSRKQFTRE